MTARQKNSARPAAKTPKKKRAPRKPAASGAGRPPAYRDEYARQATELCLLGYTDKDLAAFFEVTETTINNWKLRYPEFLESIRAGKTVADAKVAGAAYRRATGEIVSLKKVLKLPKGVLREVTIEEYVPGDSAAQRFWLMNRQPERWKPERHIFQSDPANPFLLATVDRVELVPMKGDGDRED